LSLEAFLIVAQHERPEAAKDRQEIGHWEVDLMAFLRNSQHMLVIHERKTRYTAAIKLANKTAAETLKALLSFFQGLPEDLKQSLSTMGLSLLIIKIYQTS
jgi:IS30 family transposase